MHGTIIYVILSKLTNFYIRKNILRAYDIYNTDMDLNKNKLIENWEIKPTSIPIQSYNKGSFSRYQREDGHRLAWFSLYCYCVWSFQNVHCIKLFNENYHG